MTGQGTQGDGYEHAGGYRPAPTFSRREIAFGVFVVLFSVAFNFALDRLAPHGPARELFIIILVAMLFAVAAWEIFRGRSLGLQDTPAPSSLLYPERIYDDEKARRRRRRLWAAFILLISLAGLAYSVQGLLETGIPAESALPAIAAAAVLLIAILAADAYHRRRAAREDEA